MLLGGEKWGETGSGGGRFGPRWPPSWKRQHLSSTIDVVECWREGRNGAKLGPDEADLAGGDLLLGKDRILSSAIVDDALNDGGCLRLNQVLSREFKVKSPPWLPPLPPPLPSLARAWGKYFHWPMGLKHYKMFSPLFCFEQVKTLKNFSRKLFTSKIKKKVEETKSSVWDFKTPKLAQIHQHSSGRYGRYVYNQSTLPDWGSALWTLRNFGRDFRKDQKGLPFRTNYSVNSRAFNSYREKYSKARQPLSPTVLSGAKLFGHRITLYTELVPHVWLVNNLTSTAPIGSPIASTWAPADICEQWERNLTACFSRRLWGRNTWRTPHERLRWRQL